MNKDACSVCSGYGRIYSSLSERSEGAPERTACPNCVAPDVSETISFAHDSADFGAARSTGYGLSGYTIGSGQDCVQINPAEARALAAHLLAWAESVEGSGG